MTRPLLLLDVDGVLNPFAAARCPPGFDEYAMFDDEEPVRLCPEHGRWISELGRLCDVAWATGWNDNANRLLAPVLGIPPLPVLAMPAPFQPRDKVPVIAAAAAGRPAVWIDDAHTPEALDWAGGRREPTLLVAIDPAIGLGRTAVDEVLRWVTELDRPPRPAPPA
ncbi:hypothetical protein GCM10023194_51450 [Planotetraspora phitsanulokensis]|uniref:Secreted protein n=1 Tax=Planotetraspora phitsanulokensis TaxID=575192 RepID=A0A8J3XKS8_9ACTN|nr:hypothetical protein [Planotetraspora phitsanulokensis]GII39873.1 hypothetical protein Pph01_48760 [Planotetraspora phitsanulokensis]